MTLAAQQLQLAGNVRGAVLALQAADSPPGRFLATAVHRVRKALTRDLDRLKSLPQIDLPGMSVCASRKCRYGDRYVAAGGRCPSA